MKAFKYILASVILVDTGNLLVKYGLHQTPFKLGSSIISSYIGIFLNPLIVLGFLATALSSIFWLAALSRSELSYAYPMISIGYIVIALASWLLFGEDLNWTRWLGIFIICGGVFLMSRSGDKK